MTTATARGRPVKHDWDAWLDGSPHVLAKGRDYDCETKSMAVMIRNRMRLTGVRLSVFVEGDTICITPKER